MDFIIDTTGDQDNLETQKSDSTLTTGNSALKEILEEYKSSLLKTKPVVRKKPDMFGDFYKDMGWANHKLKKQNLEAEDQLIVAKRDINEILKKSIVTPEFEQLHSVPPYEVSEKKLREERRKEREKTKGTKWFGLPATEMTDEIKKDLEVLQMRSVLDPKRFYKKNDLKVLPKYFQVGKVMDSPLDYYNNRLTRKQRKKTLVDELMADAEFNRYNRRKYKEIIEERQKTHYKAWRQAKKLKKKNK